MIRHLTGVAGALVLAVVVAACGQAPAPSSQPSPSLTSAPSPSIQSPTGLPAATATPSHGDATDPPEEDEALLAILPEDVGGTPLRMEHQAFVDAVGDPAFAASLASAVFFVAPGPADIASGLVARPRDGVYSEDWLLDWRETYDNGACGQAGGVGGRAETNLGGRPVHITTCAGGMRVYHAWVKEQGVVVSLISIGEDRWGEQVMGSLRS